MVKGFHPDPYRIEGSHNDVPKRVTIPAGIAAAGAKALSFHPEKPSCRSPSSAHARCLQGRPPTHDPGLSEPKRCQHQSPHNVHPLPSTWPKGGTTNTATSLATTVRAVHLPGPPPRHPWTRAKAPTNTTLHSRREGQGKSHGLAGIEPHGNLGEGNCPPSPKVIVVWT
jgi:hypothetical protein